MGVVPPRRRAFSDNWAISPIATVRCSSATKSSLAFASATGRRYEMFGGEPDLVMLGKVIGGGMPIGAVAGRAELMDLLAPVGPVYQAGHAIG